jgi:hypothetical protein
MTHSPRLIISFVFFVALAGCGGAPTKPPSVIPIEKSAQGVALSPLTETDVLGFDTVHSVSEDEIAKAAGPRGKIQVKRGAAVMLIHAGAAAPDEIMLREAGNSFAVTPFSGFAQRRNEAGESANLSRALRLTAAKGGNDFLVVYWPALESGDGVSGAPNWRAITGDIPYDAEQVRLRLRLLIVDVKTGHWATASPEILEEKAARGGWFRKPTSAQRVAGLKERAYKHALQELLRVLL